MMDLLGLYPGEEYREKTDYVRASYAAELTERIKALEADLAAAEDRLEAVTAEGDALREAIGNMAPLETTMKFLHDKLDYQQVVLDLEAERDALREALKQVRDALRHADPEVLGRDSMMGYSYVQELGVWIDEQLAALGKEA